jgi:hypothetical protein
MDWTPPYISSEDAPFWTLHGLSVNVRCMSNAAVQSPPKKSPVPWIILGFWFAWVLAMAWMARGEFTKIRPKHERERKTPARLEPL